ncbi:MAG: F0F1 ATP synthase subunit alpha [Candidatus Omnitrophota bacterium]
METFQIREVGEIKEIKKSVAKVTGLSSCMNGQVLDITAKANPVSSSGTYGAKGMIMGFSEDAALILLLGKTEEVKVGDRAYSSMESFKIPAGEGFRGRIVNALAEPLDGKGPIVSCVETQDAQRIAQDAYPIFRDAPGVLERVPITEVFETGSLIIDAAIPIGKGQRELIIGDRMLGKSTICIDAVLNQKGKDVICVYCCIGRSYAFLTKIVETFKVNGVLGFTIVVSAAASSPVGEQYLAPYTACALGEYFMDNGKDVFVVFDDLSKHAWAYRQISLLLERSPGRDAYPGDVFYLHSQLMERAGKLSPERGGGSMTFFPIVDTLQGDITGFIPSNLVSMTDGQIYLNAALFSAGFKPAIDFGLSVSRIGNKVQCPAMKELSAMLRLEYIQYNDLVRVTRFKASISEEVTRALKHGEVATQLFRQDKNRPYSLEEELILLYALRLNILEVLSKEAIERFKKNILNFARENFSPVLKELQDKKALTPEIKRGLNKCLIAFFKTEGL